MHVESMVQKSDALAAYKAYKAWLNTQKDPKLRRLQTDHRDEYMSDEFSKHLCSCGTVHSLTVHHTPEQNGIAE